MCQDLDTLDTSYCCTVPPVRQIAIMTSKKKYVKDNSAVRFALFLVICVSFICINLTHLIVASITVQVCGKLHHSLDGIHRHVCDI